MKTMRIFLCVLLTGIFFSECSQTSYKKTKGGMPYKLFRGEGTQKLRPGGYVKLNLVQKINDSVMYSTANGLPVYLLVNPQTEQPYDISELWTSLYVGDSVIATQMMDTFIKRAPENVPPRFKKGDRIVTSFKILGVFSNDSLARLDEEKGKQAFLAKEIKEIEKYLGEKKISAQKTSSGAFVETLRPGSGNRIDSGNYVTLNYTGTSWSGKKFDSNTDTNFHHNQPLSFVAGGRQMIKGFDEGVMMMQKGTLARIYIPSILGFGGNPNSPNIKPYENVFFDIEITDVQEKEPPPNPIAPVPKKVDVTQQKNK